MSIAYQHAIKALEASAERAGTLGASVSIAVVDIYGYLIAFARLDSNRDLIDFAVKKAKVAAIFNEVDDRLEIMAVRTGNHAHLVRDFRQSVEAIAGTALIKNTLGDIIGVIASSGGSPDQNGDIAAAGAKVCFQ